jgi:hypothetical protein
MCSGKLVIERQNGLTMVTGSAIRLCRNCGMAALENHTISSLSCLQRRIEKPYCIRVL